MEDLYTVKKIFAEAISAARKVNGDSHYNDDFNNWIWACDFVRQRFCLIQEPARTVPSED